jgi:putative transposase
LEGRKRQSTAGILDSQNVKGSERCGRCGYDAGNKINGRKGLILVDTLGLLLLVMVLP